MKYVLPLLLVLILPSVSATGQPIAQAATDETVSDETGTDQTASEEAERAEEARKEQRRRWRETLMFGIDSQVAELLETLANDRVEELADDVLQALESREDSQVVRRAIGYFRTIGDPRGEQPAVAVLREADTRPESSVLESLRYIAATVETPEADTVETIRSLLDSFSERVAAEAALTLGHLGDAESIDALIATFDRRDQISIRGNIVLALGHMGERAVETAEWLTELMLSTARPNTVRYYAADTLGKIGASDAVGALHDMSRTDDGMMRAYALSALLALDADDLGPRLTQAMRDDNWRVRQLAVEGVGRAGRSEDLAAVRYISRQDPDHRVRRAAIEALGRFDGGDATDALVEMMLSSTAQFESRSLAIDALSENSLGDSIEHFASLVDQEAGTRDHRLIQHLSNRLSGLEHRSLAGLFETLLEHPDPAVRTYAVRGIGLNRFTSFSERLEELSGERQPASMRRAAEQALDRM